MPDILMSHATMPFLPSDYLPAALPTNEAERLAALRRADILDTPPEAAFDRLTRIAAQLIGTPITLVSLIDGERQWFKAKTGLESIQTPRDWAFCAHAILKPDEVLIVPDAAVDVRFRSNPLVVGAPHIRFYAGAPIVTHDGYALGTVCAIDSKPRADIGPREASILMELAHIAADEIELRQLARQLNEEIRQRHSAEQARAYAESVAVRQRASQSLSRLTGGIAHEFNNLFTGLILLTESLQSSADAALQKSLIMMMDAFHHGSSLTNGMLAYSGQQFLEPGKLEVGPILQNVSAIISALHGTSAKIALEIGSDCGAIEADGRQLLAALAELAANAVEAAAPAAAAITLSASNATLTEDAAKSLSPDGRAGAFVRLTVSDKGPGMSDEVRIRACEPFFTTKPVGSGPGLGLSMAQGFARQSKGFLVIEAAVGAGTTVAMFFPRV